MNARIRASPKESRYIAHHTLYFEGLRNALSAALGVRGAVRKRRTIYRIGQTRVHLDQIEGLGEFVELEVVLRPDQEAEDGHVIARRFMTDLGILTNQLIDNAYIDMLG